MKKCPFCAEEIQDEAIKCRHCGEQINSFKENEKSKKNFWNKYKRWIFLSLIILTIYVPQMFSSNLSPEIIFGYPIDKEYQFARSMGSVIAAFLILYFLIPFKMNGYFAAAVSFFSIIPAMSLLVSTAMFFYYKKVNEEIIVKNGLKKSIKDALILFLGYLGIFLILTAFSGLFYTPDKLDLLRLFIGLFLVFLVSRKSPVFNQKSFAIYIIFSISLNLFLIM